MTRKLNRQLLFAQHQEMETERLLLGPIALADAADMFEYASDDETTAYVFPTHKSLDETLESIADYFLAQLLEKYALELKETHKMIGTIDLRLDAEHQRGEIGYTLNKNYWSQGLTSEASEKITWLAFEKMALLRLEAIHDQRNPASGRVLQKIGMQKEGSHPAHRFAKSGMVTDISYGMTKADYDKQGGS